MYICMSIALCNLFSMEVFLRLHFVMHHCVDHGGKITLYYLNKIRPCISTGLLNLFYFPPSILFACLPLSFAGDLTMFLLLWAIHLFYAALGYKSEARNALQKSVNPSSPQKLAQWAGDEVI